MNPGVELVVETPEGLACPAGGFVVDPLLPVPLAVLTHAHGDHARPGSAVYLCTTGCAPLVRRRLGADARIETMDYGEKRKVGEVLVSFHPAGHMLGSAQVRLESAAGEVWVVSGDYKREADPTCAPFEPVRCDTFITEATYALPLFRWDDPAGVAREIFEWWSAGADRASLLFCYAFGKAQRILAELAALTDRPVYVHGMMEPVVQVYRAAGVRMLPTRLVAETQKGRSFHGELVLAPVTARGSPWMKRFGDFEAGFTSGLLRVRGTRRRRGFDRGFVLSDHADWPGLLRSIRESGASRVLATHGHREPLVRYLRESGLDARALGPLHETDPEGD